MIRVAVIGVGAMGINHVRDYSRMKGVKLVAISDLNEELGKKVAKEYNVRFYSNYLELLEKESVDGVSVVVPTQYHEKVALDVIEKKVHLLVEKPLAPTVKDAKRIYDAAKKQKVILLVGHVERFNPAAKKLKSLIDEKKFGDILSLNVKRVGPFSPRMNGVNVVTDLAVHDLDIVCSLLGKLPKKVIARGGGNGKNSSEDHAEIFLDYKSFACFIQVNWVTPIKIRTLSLTGKKGYLELDYVAQTLQIYKSKTLPKNRLKSFKEFTQFAHAEKEEFSFGPHEPLLLELKHFIQCIKRKEKPLVIESDVLNAIKLSQLINKSIRTGAIKSV